ncbi:unnamed protein product [Closterium sp. Yama58-4]|nr:unnamed protein product [Closterium sp. Yama58-4]
MALCVSCPSADILCPCARPQANASPAGASRLRCPFRAPPVAALPASSAFLTRVPLRSGRLTRVDSTSRHVSKRAVTPRATAEGSGGKPPGAGDGETFLGVYGPWKIEDSDRTEVFLYRAGLVTASLSFLLAASSAFLPPDSPLLPLFLPALDPLFALGVAGLGTGGYAGREGVGVVEYVVGHGGGVWAVGPLFAALTGLVFKEGLCYGKLEAALLVFVIPTLLLGHLSGLMDVTVEKGLLAVWMALFAVFAARKFTQPIKDDIGDKSVFIFQALPEQQQQELLARLNMQNRDSE